jgi:hypothetical protein
VQDRKDATFRERVDFGRYGGIGGDLIPPRNFVNRSSANNSDGQQPCCHQSVNPNQFYRQALSAEAIIGTKSRRHKPSSREWLIVDFYQSDS